MQCDPLASWYSVSQCLRNKLIIGVLSGDFMAPARNLADIAAANSARVISLITTVLPLFGSTRF